MVTIDICGEAVQFFPTYMRYGSNGSFYTDAAKRYFMKRPHKIQDLICEVTALRRLQKYDKYFPRLFAVAPTYFVVNFIDGVASYRSVYPPNFLDQLKEAANYLEAEQILHGDLHAQQIMLDKSGNLWIVDYGYVSYQNTRTNGAQRMRDQKYTLESFARQKQLLPKDPAAATEIGASMMRQRFPNFRGYGL